MTYTEEQLRQVAIACFVNAKDLYEDACLLGKHARYPRALILAVIGAEEFVKSVVYTIAALNPSEHVRLPPVLAELKSHNLKHLGACRREKSDRGLNGSWGKHGRPAPKAVARLGRLGTSHHWFCVLQAR
jgi:AbiV family abortive infection protein